MPQRAEITLLGVRGSLPVSGRPFSRYGGGTMSVLLSVAGERIILDAGSGLAAGGPEADGSGPVSVLLSHAHVDHLIGLPMYSPLFEVGRKVTIWARERAGLTARQQVASLVSPPLWPVGTEGFRAQVAYRDLPQGPVTIGPVRVLWAEGAHPGGVSVYRLEWAGGSLVYATDCELTEGGSGRLAEFARGCSLLLCDAQYTDEEYAHRVGWGHSSLSMALAFAARCGAERTVLIHHDPRRTDEELDAMAEAVRRVRPAAVFGRAGQMIFL